MSELSGGDDGHGYAAVSLVGIGACDTDLLSRRDDARL
ncbi:hypothetical protein DOT_5461 [Desulfosporosinus sp. OT]|nr:hypothetical protein DOT_5461 [Desulfosporosinus sp. OT]